MGVVRAVVHQPVAVVVLRRQQVFVVHVADRFRFLGRGGGGRFFFGLGGSLSGSAARTLSSAAAFAASSFLRSGTRVLGGVRPVFSRLSGSWAASSRSFSNLKPATQQFRRAWRSNSVLAAAADAERDGNSQCYGRRKKNSPAGERREPIESQFTHGSGLSDADRLEMKRVADSDERHDNTPTCRIKSLPVAILGMSRISHVGLHLSVCVE